MQVGPLKYDPSWGTLRQGEPIDAEAYRYLNPYILWVFNPWTGQPRGLDIIKKDPFGQAIAVMLGFPEITVH